MWEFQFYTFVITVSNEAPFVCVATQVRTLTVAGHQLGHYKQNSKRIDIATWLACCH